MVSDGPSNVGVDHQPCPSRCRRVSARQFLVEGERALVRTYGVRGKPDDGFQGVFLAQSEHEIVLASSGYKVMCFFLIAYLSDDWYDYPSSLPSSSHGAASPASLAFLAAAQAAQGSAISSHPY